VRLVHSWAGSEMELFTGVVDRSITFSSTGRSVTGEVGSWIRPHHARSNPRGTRGAIPLSSSFQGGDPK